MHVKTNIASVLIIAGFYWRKRYLMLMLESVKYNGILPKWGEHIGGQNALKKHFTPPINGDPSKCYYRKVRALYC